MEELLPEEYQALEVYATRLPLRHRTKFHPFGGIVVNLRACTKAHRDQCDAQDICVVAFMGEWEGGDLCLYEPGLRFTVRRGDVLIFPSARLTHFNLHYQGVRMSFVLHTDKAGQTWVKDRNEWKPQMNADSDSEEETEDEW